LATPVLMPKLGLTMTKGTVLKWFKNEGDKVEKGEKLLLFETEKVSTEISSPTSGVLLKIVVPQKVAVAVGQVVGYVGEPGERVADVGATTTQQPAVQGTSQEQRSSAQASAGTQDIRASPKAKRVAAENSVDLSKVKGTGPAGMISEEDVQKAIQESRGKTLMGLNVKEIIPLSETRKIIGKRLTSSLQTMAQVTLVYEMDATELVALREKRLPEVEASTSARLTYTDILVKVVARALKELPIMNSTLEEDGIKVIDEVNIGVAVASDRGLIVPVVRNADAASLTEVVTAMKDMASRGREGKLTLKEVTSGTFTITNLGMTAVDAFTPIINPPQVGILAIGRIVKKPAVVDETIAVRPMVTFSLTFDHRVVDGFTAAEFLRKTVEILQDPARLAEAAR
jgi:pyruvate dehydrogenase E2 component (dihydrolipoamide acetyltransferase)